MISHVINVSNIATGIIVVVVSGLIGWGARWIINQGPTATANQRLKDLLDTNERVMKELIEEKNALTGEKLEQNKRISGLERDVLRLTAQNGRQQTSIDDLTRYLELINAIYTQETGKTLPAMAGSKP